MSTIISDDPQSSILEQIRSFSARCVTPEKNSTRNVIVEHCMVDHDEVTSSRSLFTRNKSQVVKNRRGSVFDQGLYRGSCAQVNFRKLQLCKGCVVEMGGYKRMYQLGGCDPVDPFLNPQLAQRTISSPFFHYVYNSSLYEVCFFVAIYLTGLMFQQSWFLL